MIVSTPSNEKYGKKYGKLLLNKKCNPLKRKKVEYKVEIETESQLRKRIGMLERKLVIKDDQASRMFVFDAMVNGDRIRTETRYSRSGKKEALTKIEKIKQQKIKELTIYFD